MDKREFNEWRKDLAVRLPSVSAWLNGLPSGKETLDTWHAIAFSGFALEEALEVTQQIQAGTIELDGWQDLPKTYRQAVCENRLARLEHAPATQPCDFGEYAYKCLECRDTGLVSCWSVDAMRRARRRLLDESVKQTWTTCAVACSCQQGDRWATMTRRKGREIVEDERPRYDPARWVKIVPRESDSRAALFEWAEQYQDPRRNYFGEYAAN